MMEIENTLKSKKEFEEFLKYIPIYMEALAKIQGKEGLNFNDDETISISEHFIDMYEVGDFTLEERKKFIAYLGEAFRKRYEGKWGFTGAKDGFNPNEPAIGAHIGGG